MRKIQASSRHKGTKNDYDGSTHTNPTTFCIQLGFFAGLFWGLVHWLLFVINFTKVMPGFLLDPFMKQSFLRMWYGQFTGIAAFIVFSIIAAFIYKLLLGRLLGPWPGILYGLFWWALLFMTIGPAMSMMKPFNKIGYETLITECCLFLLWGLFIGYTIAFEFTDEAGREPSGSHKSIA
ncbi:YqhR family membrane protein [Paenibacillus albus]|uniref:YqhR family membrane protein n=1 Tax=Paenibacillus albus TaxID=2495582 RepID=UPI001D1317C5|nr:YqhR family membrane protein [Paenibacillus albus]